jgi:hypothetical protein
MLASIDSPVVVSELGGLTNEEVYRRCQMKVSGRRKRIIARGD